MKWLKADKFLVVTHGASEEIARAKDIIAAMSPAEMDVQTPGEMENAATV